VVVEGDAVVTEIERVERAGSCDAARAPLAHNHVTRAVVGAIDDAAEVEAERVAGAIVNASRGNDPSFLRLTSEANPRISRSRRETVDVGPAPALGGPVTRQHKIRRKPNVFTKNEVLPVRSLKSEIAAHYIGEPTPAFHSVWARGPLLSIEQLQPAGLPVSSSALLARTAPAGSRPDNPSAVIVHGWIGMIEAALRGSPKSRAFMTPRLDKASSAALEKEQTPVAVPQAGLETQPGLQPAVKSSGQAGSVSAKLPRLQGQYDGGHLVAYQFMMADANVYKNVVPQGKALNSGPFGSWEDKIVAQAIRNTRRRLEEVGVTDEKMPHLFDYEVGVEYPASPYEVGAQQLAEIGLIPRDDVGKLAEPIRLTKRIPVSWSGYAQPLSYPSSAELGLQEGMRPTAEYVLADTQEYGAIDDENKARTNQEFIARGPASLVRDLPHNFTPGEMDLAERLAKNASRTTFVRLVDWSRLWGQAAEAEEEFDYAPVVGWAETQFSPDQEPVKKIGPNFDKKHQKGMYVINSDWDYQGHRYTPEEITDRLKLFNDRKPPPGDHPKVAAEKAKAAQKALTALGAPKHTPKSAPKRTSPEVTREEPVDHPATFAPQLPVDKPATVVREDPVKQPMETKASDPTAEAWAEYVREEEFLFAYLTEVNKVRAMIEGQKEKKSAASKPASVEPPQRRGRSQDTEIDFRRGTKNLSPAQLMKDITRFQFEAQETQPD
jgi:hypothetical protein